MRRFGCETLKKCGEARQGKLRRLACGVLAFVWRESGAGERGSAADPPCGRGLLVAANVHHLTGVAHRVQRLPLCDPRVQCLLLCDPLCFPVKSAFARPRLLFFPSMLVSSRHCWCNASPRKSANAAVAKAAVTALSTPKAVRSATEPSDPRGCRQRLELRRRRAGDVATMVRFRAAAALCAKS